MHLSSTIPTAFLALVVFSAADAQAQCAFDQSSPNANDIIREPQADMTLRFLMPFELQDVRIYDEARVEWPITWMKPTGDVQTAEFRPVKPLPPGNYLIEWNGYLRQHYHPDGGSVAFTVASADAPITPAAKSEEGSAHRYGPGSPYPAFLGGGAPQAGR